MQTIHAIVVHHRGLEMLGECLETLLASQEIDLQVVIVLNGCDEALPEIVERSERVHVVEASEPLGFSAANNLGVLWADQNLGSCSSLYFVNNDTVSEPEALARQARVFEDDPKVAVVGPQLLIQWAPTHLNSLGLNVTKDGWGWDEGIGISLDDYGEIPTKREVLAVTGSALLIRSDVFKRVGGWTELYDYYFEDIDLCLKVRRAGWLVVHQPAAVVYHAVSATTGLDSEWKNFLFWRNRILLAMLHWPLGLLMRTVFPIVVIDGIVAQLWQDSRLQRKALMGALRRLPRVLWLRMTLKGRERGWVAMLRPPGSVPVITLPEMPVGPEKAAVARADVVEAEIEVRRWRAELGDGRPAVVILGTAPLPTEEALMNFAPGGRTWQFIQGLTADGIRPLVLCERMPGGYDEPESRVEVEHAGSGLIIRMSDEDFHSGEVVPRMIEAFDPTCLVGASARPSGRAVAVAKGRPVWVDLFGDPMGEAQARAARCDEGDQLTAYRDLVATLVENGDAFSVVSERQRDAALGQLGFLGRLNRLTAGHCLVHVIPCAAAGEGWPDEPDEHDDPDAPGSVTVPEEAFVVLWSGGFNTWCDVQTLANGVEGAMGEEASLHLVVTGGSIAGHDDDSWREWLERVEASPFGERIHILGNVPTSDLGRWTQRADVGLITEKPLVERELGSSGRVVAWLEAGLPFVATEQSDLVKECVKKGAAYPYAVGDALSLASTLVSVCRERTGLAGAAAGARRLAATLSAESTTVPLRQWAGTAGPAPDRQGEGSNPLSHWALAGALKCVEDQREVLMREKAHLEAEVTQAKTQLGEIHTSVMWRTWAVLRRLKAIGTYPWRKLRGRTGG